MKRLLTLLLALTLLLSLAACGGSKDADDEDEGESTVDSAATPDEADEDEEDTFVVSTPYADLKLPASFEGAVTYKVASEEPYILTFSAKDDDTELFSVLFNAEGDVLLGTLIGEEENTVIYMNFAALDQQSENYGAYVQYQEKASAIAENLQADYNFVLNNVITQPEYSDETYDIPTPVVTLQYPAHWKDKITVDVTDEAAQFSSKNVKLFDISFVKKDNAFLIGLYKETPVYLITCELKKGDLSQTDFDELNMMQEDSNVIVTLLLEDSDFSLAADAED